MLSRTGSVLSLPFRRSAQMSLAETIRGYINDKYDQHPDMFRADLETVDALRRDAVNVREAHPSGVRKLQAWAGNWLGWGASFPLM